MFEPKWSKVIKPKVSILQYNRTLTSIPEKAFSICQSYRYPSARMDMGKIKINPLYIIHLQITTKLNKAPTVFKILRRLKRIAIMPILSSLVAPQVVVMTTYSASYGEKLMLWQLSVFSGCIIEQMPFDSYQNYVSMIEIQCALTHCPLTNVFKCVHLSNWNR